jgi:hypothetical protein
MNALMHMPQARSADLRSAVPQNCILRSPGRFSASAAIQRSADYKSAIQQIANLRYEFGVARHSFHGYLGGFAYMPTEAPAFPA